MTRVTVVRERIRQEYSKPKRKKKTNEDGSDGNQRPAIKGCGHKACILSYQVGAIQGGYNFREATHFRCLAFLRHELVT